MVFDEFRVEFDETEVELDVVEVWPGGITVGVPSPCLESFGLSAD